MLSRDLAAGADNLAAAGPADGLERTVRSLRGRHTSHMGGPSSHDAKNTIAFRHLVSGPEGRPNGTATLPFFLAAPRGSTKSPLS